MMNPRLLAPFLGMLCLVLALSARADYFSPLDFGSGGAFPAGSVTIDTNTLTVNGSVWPGASIESQPSGPDVAVFSFDGNTLIGGNVLLVGSRPAVILFQSSVTLRGVWTVRSGRTTDGPGDGGNSTNGGGGGGGYGGAGGRGAGNPFGPGGAAYGDLFTALQAGSGGGGVLGETGDTVFGGGGLEIGARGTLFLDAATINANGSNGTTTFSKGAGGGSGGGVFLHAFDVDMIDATLTANGGQGGPGASGFPGGGGGGGGRIAILRNSAGSGVNSGTSILVQGGAEGVDEPYTNGEAGAGGTVHFQTDPIVGIPKDARTLIRGISLEVDTATGSVTVQWSGDTVNFGDAGDPGYYGFKFGWGLASGGDISWFEESQHNNLVASLFPNGLQVFPSTVGANSSPFSSYQVFASSALATMLEEKYGEGFSSFSEVVIESPSTEFFYEGTVSVVPEPTPNLLVLAASLLVALRHRSRRE